MAGCSLWIMWRTVRLIKWLSELSTLQALESGGHSRPDEAAAVRNAVQPRRTTCTYFWRCPAAFGPSLFFSSSNLSCVLYVRLFCCFQEENFPLNIPLVTMCSVCLCSKRLRAEIDLFLNYRGRKKNNIKHLNVWSWVAMGTRIFKLCKYCTSIAS